jgi:hypothetical protein
MENAIMITENKLASFDIRSEKRKKQEDLSLIREMLQTYEDMKTNNLIMSKEDLIRFGELESAETLLLDELNNIDKMLLEFIAESKDTLKKSSDLMDTGKAVNLDFSGEKGAIKQSKGREIKQRRNADIMKLDIEVLINLNKENMKNNSVKSVRGFCAMVDRNYDNTGKQERELIKQAVYTFWKGV